MLLAPLPQSAEIVEQTAHPAPLCTHTVSAPVHQAHQIDSVQEDEVQQQSQSTSGGGEQDVNRGPDVHGGEVHAGAAEEKSMGHRRSTMVQAQSEDPRAMMQQLKAQVRSRVKISKKYQENVH